jgi:hypothetical protein
MENTNKLTETDPRNYPTLYKGFEIVRNEFGTFNVSTINCFATPSVTSAMKAIDAYEWKAAMAKGVAAVEAEREQQLDAMFPKSRRKYCATCKGSFCMCCQEPA